MNVSNQVFIQMWSDGQWILSTFLKNVPFYWNYKKQLFKGRSKVIEDISLETRVIIHMGNS